MKVKPMAINNFCQICDFLYSVNSALVTKLPSIVAMMVLMSPLISVISDWALVICVCSTAISALSDVVAIYLIFLPKGMGLAPLAALPKGLLFKFAFEGFPMTGFDFFGCDFITGLP